METQNNSLSPGFKGHLAPEQAVHLFCFPYSGASAGIFSGWGRKFPGHITVSPIELPGHGRRMREPLAYQMDRLVDTVAEAVYPVMDQPFAFFGHSLGALLCFELARYLRRKFDREPLHLFVSGHPAPHLLDPRPPIYDLPNPEFQEKIKEMHGADESFFQSPELLEIFLPILRADFATCETYQFHADEPLNCPITVLGGLLDADTPRSTLEAWQAHTRSSCKVRMFPGNHFFIHDSLPVLIEVLARELLFSPGMVYQPAF